MRRLRPPRMCRPRLHRTRLRSPRPRHHRRHPPLLPRPNHRRLRRRSRRQGRHRPRPRTHRPEPRPQPRRLTLPHRLGVSRRHRDRRGLRPRHRVAGVNRRPRRRDRPPAPQDPRSGGSSLRPNRAMPRRPRLLLGPRIPTVWVSPSDVGATDRKSMPAPPSRSRRRRWPLMRWSRPPWPGGSRGTTQSPS